MKSNLFNFNSGIFFKFTFAALLFFFVKGVFAQTDSAQDVAKLFITHCAECHNEHRLGGIGPVLLPENLKYLRKPAAINIIRNGHLTTPMPIFKEKLSDEEILSLVDFIYTPLTKIPDWNMAKIKASQDRKSVV